MTRFERQLIDDLTEISGLHPKIVDFAIFNGFILAADQSLAEQLRDVERRYGLSRSESLDLLADDFRDAVAEFYSEAFPIVGGFKI